MAVLSPITFDPDSVDRISDLPDSILGHILSFLPAERAVATAILSQRWKTMWTTISHLDLRCSGRGADRFVDFVNYVLLHHKPECLNTFSLSCFGCPSSYVNIWISAAITRKVRELILRFYVCFTPSVNVQRSMFSCESLTSLELSLEICIPHDMVFSLPKLETLRLGRVVLGSEETLCNVLGGCPELKYLFSRIDMRKTIEKCELDEGIAFRCVISSTSLRHLWLISDGGKLPRCYVQLDAPSLEYMSLFHVSSISIRQSLIFLVGAVVRLANLEPQYKDQNHYNSVVDALHACSCVQTLWLTPEVITAFSLATVEMKTKFNKLTRLEVKKDWIYWRSLHQFLTLSDNLQVFIINTHFDYSEEKLDCSEEKLTLLEPNLVPRCLSNSLRKVVIKDYDGNEDDFRMAAYILKHGSVLQLMQIHLRFDDIETKCELIQKICELPRKLAACEVKFSNDRW